MANVKQIDGRITELALRPGTTYGRASTPTASTAITQNASGSSANVSGAIAQRTPAVIAARTTVTAVPRRRGVHHRVNTDVRWYAASMRPSTMGSADRT